MSVKTYSLKSDGNKALSKNFKVKEFACHDGSDKILIDDNTVKKLQFVRDYFGKPIHINSAYRTPTYNKKVGGATSSQHVKGTAADIAINGVPPKAIAALLEKYYPNSGIGLYDTFVHIDSRGKKSYWKNTGNNVVNSFNQGNIYEKYKGTSEEESSMSKEEFKSQYNDMLDEIKKLSPHSYSANSRKWAEENKLITGDENGFKYQMYVTREELMEILYRFYQKFIVK